MLTSSPGNTPQSSFTTTLIAWDRLYNERTMPWKKERNPYKIWLSEIILQQTRVEQGLPYFERFVRSYPDIHHLAAASDEAVFRLWQGLGYYARCRNMLATARQIVSEYNGHFPDTYEGLLQLKGIGAYTAAAIAAFAYRLPHAVVDGNVFRVLSRYFGIRLPVDSTEGKKYFTSLANELLDRSQPDVYNQAIMDFGAVVCKPRQPLCGACPLQKHCVAFRNGEIAQLPVKSKKISIRKRYFHYFVILHGNQWYIHQRDKKDIWQHLHEFPLIEKDRLYAREMLRDEALQAMLGGAAFEVKGMSGIYRQQLTHQLIAARFYYIQLLQPWKVPGSYFPVREELLSRYAFPKIIVSFLQDLRENTLILKKVPTTTKRLT